PDPLVDDDVLAGFETVDVDAENRPRAVRAVLVALKPRLRLAVVRDEQQDTAVDRLGAAGGGKRDRKPQAARTLRAGDEHTGTGQHQSARKRDGHLRIHGASPRRRPGM